MAEPEVEHWYRYEDRLYAAGVNEYGDPEGPPSVGVHLIRYRVKHHTPTGVRLACGRFVRRDARKRFACPTMPEALESFLARKTRQISIYTARIKHAERARDIVRGRCSWQRVNEIEL